MNKREQIIQYLGTLDNNDKQIFIQQCKVMLQDQIDSALLSYICSLLDPKKIDKIKDHEIDLIFSCIPHNSKKYDLPDKIKELENENKRLQKELEIVKDLLENKNQLIQKISNLINKQI